LSVITRAGASFALVISLCLGALAMPVSAVTFISISGHVTDAVSGLPLTGVCVEIHPVSPCDPSEPIHTDVNGDWTTGPVLPAGGDWTVNYVFGGYVTSTDQVNSANSNVFLTEAMQPVGNPCTTGGTPTSTTWLPNITRRLGGPTGWDTPFYVQNAGAASTTIEASFFFFDTGGFAACHKTTNLTAGASVGDDPNNAPDLLDGKQYSVVVKSFGSPAVAAVNQTQTAGGALQALAYSGFSGGNTTVYVPNVTRRFFGYDVPLIIQNLGTLSTTVTATFKSFDNTQNVPIQLTIPAGRSGVIDPDFTPGLTDQTQYAVKLTSGQPIGVIANAHNEAIGPLAFSHNGLATGATTLYGPYALKSGPVSGNATLFSNVVVQNVGASATSATLTFTPIGGGANQTFTTASIPAGGAQAFDVRFNNGIAVQNTPQCGGTATSTCLGNGNYSLKITASQQIAAVVLPNSNSTAAGYLAAAAPTTKVVLPIVQRNAGTFNSPIHLQSVTATSATLKYFVLGSGTLATTQTVTLTAGTSTKIDPATVSGLADGQTYSGVITSSGTLTAVVDELSTQAGDNDMIYEGFAQ
jgi:hypothetical protein